MPEYIMNTGVDFASLDTSNHNTNSLADTFNYRFQGIQSTLPVIPLNRIQTITATDMSMVSNFCKIHTSGQPQTDFELTVAQRITQVRIEVTQDTYVAPSWENGMELV